ncbi:MAG: hypothetical protein K2P26_03065 [Oscillospiraceae bacterium]|nr:hypothetical protein [Oscillospiraceae bacterium]
MEHDKRMKGSCQAISVQRAFAKGKFINPDRTCNWGSHTQIAGSGQDAGRKQVRALN